MRSEIDLDAASQAGIIGEDQAIALRNFQAAQDRIPHVSAEKFQLFGGFADLSGALGLALIQGASGAISYSLELAPLALAMVPALFLLARVVNLRANPATAFVILLAYLGFGINFVPALLELAGLWSQSSNLLQALSYLVPLPILGWLFWRAHRFPPTLALAALIEVAAILAFMSAPSSTPYSMDQLWPGAANLAEVTGLFIGVAALLAAIWWDISDIRRETYRSQVAFWLHCVAGFLITRSLLMLITGSRLGSSYIFDVGPGLSDWLPVAIMILAATCLSLLLDRRSLMVSSILPCVGIVEWAILTPLGAFHPVGMILAGAWLTLFAWSWNGWRRNLLLFLPTWLVAQLPRTNIEQLGQRPTRRHLPLLPLRLRK